DAIAPGTMFVDLNAFPEQQVAELLRALHSRGRPDPTYPPVAHHIAYLFDSWARHRRQDPELVEVVSPELFEQGRQRALELAAGDSQTALLHGDLTPVNVLDGGPERGLVAIDPAPCIGDPAFDAVDLLYWRATDGETIAARADALGAACGIDPS